MDIDYTNHVEGIAQVV